MNSDDFGPNPIAIIGLAGRFPGARNIGQYWHNLMEGIESVTSLGAEELRRAGVPDALINDPQYVPSGAFLEDMDCFDAGFHGISPREAAIMDPQHRQFLEVCWEALEHAACVPSESDAAIGVFAGSGYNAYFASHVLTHADLLDQYGFFLLRHTGNDKDFLATRVSYQFGLSGPSVNIQTACSTSLAAVHQACQSLLAGECDIALAGAVSIDLPQRQGYLYRDGEVASPDGHCRPFDAAAEGTFFGSGAGVVVIKPLAQAIEDGDAVHAVIRGSALNNDGAAKVSYLAPSVDAQAAAVAEALSIADVDPADISYVEAHGTGTSLGDPIEFAALRSVFDAVYPTDRHCYLGSVKANIGHLDTASGIAGLIKTIEALKHRQIPPLLHYSQPNPALDIESSAFRINTRPVPWAEQQSPRMAGVTSLGVGGTNVHVVLQEYVGESRPESPQSEAGRQYQLLPVSARTAAALRRASEQLAQHLQRGASTALAATAHTLQSGRRAFEYRRFVLAGNLQEATESLQQASADTAPAALSATPVPETPPPLCFLFAGGGSQYPGMGAGLYSCEPRYRRTIDDCLALLADDVVADIAPLLRSATACAAAGTILARPSRGLPALFAVQMAQALTWRDYGIKPAALIGHSLGDYAAACIAGVFDMASALAIVVKRAELFEQVAEGSMLSVMAAADTLGPWLEPGVSLAAINAPDLCVCSGPSPLIQALARQLEAHDIDFRSVPIDVAAHSAMLDPVLPQFEAFLQTIDFQKPQIPMVSNVSGDWADAQALVSPAYWVGHLRETVRFTDGVQRVLADDNQVFLEIGPGGTLANLVAANSVSAAPRPHTFLSMRREADRVDDERFLLTTLGQLWVAGVAVNWQALQGDSPPRKVSLPTYPFERDRHWLEPRRSATVATNAVASHESTAAAGTVCPWFATPDWQLMPVASAAAKGSAGTSGSASASGAAGQVILLADTGGLYDALEEALTANGWAVSVVRRGDRYVESSQGWVVDAQNAEHLERLASALQAGKASQPNLPLRLMNLWYLDSLPVHDVEPSTTSHSQTRPAGSPPPALATSAARRLDELVLLVQAFDALGIDTSLTLVTSDASQVGGERHIDPDKAVLAAAVPVINKEMPQLDCACVDVQLPANRAGLAALARTLAADVARQWREPARHPVRALRAGRCYVPGLSALWCDADDTAAQPPNGPDAPLAALATHGKVCLITGGFGAIGYRIAQHLAGTAKARLILLGRGPLPPRHHYQACLDSSDTPAATRRAIGQVLKLEALGAQVLALAVELSDAGAVDQAVTDATDHFGQIDIVLHAAGTLDDSLIATRTQSQSARVLAPKIAGTLNLDRALAQTDLDSFVLFSSTSARLGLAGQLDYAAANAFLGAFARYRYLRDGSPTLAIDWDRWEEIGMAARAAKPAVTGSVFDRQALTATTSESLRQLSPETDWVLDEHRLKHSGDAVLPGTAWLAYLVEALREAHRARQPAADDATPAPTLTLNDVVLASPLILADEATTELQVSVCSGAHDGARSTAADVCISSRSSEVESGPGIEHVRAQALWVTEPSPDRAADPATISSIRRRCTRSVTLAGAAQHPFVRFGERWRCVDSIDYGDGEALIHLQLAAPWAADTEAWSLHPALFDMALGAAYELLPVDADRGYIPLGYQQLRLVAPLGTRLCSHVRRRAEPGPGEDLAVLDVDVMDTQGRILVQVEGFSLQCIALSAVTAMKAPRSSGRRPTRPAPNLSTDSSPSGPARPDSLALAADLSAGAGIRPTEGVQALELLLGMPELTEVIVSPRLHDASIAPGVSARHVSAAGESAPDYASIDWTDGVSLAQSAALQEPNATGSAGAAASTRRASLSISTPYRKPVSEIEQGIAGMWEDALGISGIGLDDSFFALGGHSLLLTQTLPKIRRLTGRRLALTQAIAAPTIAAWAALLDHHRPPSENRQTNETLPAVEPAAEPADDAHARVVHTGAVAPTPGPARFLSERGKLGLAQWNIATVLTAVDRVDEDALAAAIQDLIERHDALRLGFVADTSGWQGRVDAPDARRALTTLDLTHLSGKDFASALERDAARVQSGFDIAGGRLLAFRLYRGSDAMRDRLLIAVHHLVHDAFSWNLLLSELQAQYKAARQRLPLPAVEASVQYSAWSAALQARACELARSGAASYWQKLPWSQRLNLSGPAPRDRNRNDTARAVTLTLPADHTSRLLSLGGHIPVEEIVLTALARSVAASVPGDVASGNLLFDVMQHGRDDEDELDVTRSIGFFVAYTPVLVPVANARSLRDALKVTCSVIHAMRERGIEHDLLRYMSSDAGIRHAMQQLPQADILFNFLGHREERGNALIDGSLFELASESPGPTHAPDGLRAYRLAIKAGIAQGQLYLTLVFSDRLDTHDDMVAIASYALAELEQLASVDETSKRKPDTFGQDSDSNPSPVLSQHTPALLSFRAWQTDDRAIYRRFLQDATLWRYLPETQPADLDDDDAASLIELCNELPDRHLVQAVLQAGQPVGQVRLAFQNDGEQAELSYWLAREARGRGLGPQMVARFVADTWHKRSELQRLFARVHPENAASRRLLQAIGFGFEGMHEPADGPAQEEFACYRSVNVATEITWPARHVARAVNDPLFPDASSARASSGSTIDTGSTTIPGRG